jgi:hypothetical protein
MSDLQAIADRVEIEALRGEFTDAVMMREFHESIRLAAHLTGEGLAQPCAGQLIFLARGALSAIRGPRR